MPRPDVLAGGHYARKQIFSRNRLVAWSHTRRFAVARQLVSPYAGRRLLDYGSGDGTFLAMVHDLFPSALGVDIEPAQVRECADRLSSLTGLTFATTDAIGQAHYSGEFQVVTCMEVLEHCPEDVRERVLDDLRRLLAPDGTLIVSVPIETGPSLAGKQAARAFASLTGLREYDRRERYTAREFLEMFFAGPHTAIPRAESTMTLADGRVLRFTGHKGFNWRALERALQTRFVVERRLFSPMPVFGGMLNSQAWFVCRSGPCA